MPDLQSGKPVLAVGLDRPGGDVAVRRAMATGLPVIVLAERGFRPPDGVVDVIEVPLNKARVGPAVRHAYARRVFWVFVPRAIGTADYLVSSVVRSAGRHLDAEHPGIAMTVVSKARSPERPYGRALGVVGLTGSSASGVAALAAVEMAARTGAALDVLVVGDTGEQQPASSEEWLRLLPVERRTELVRLALTRAREHGVSTTWSANGSGDMLAAVEQAMGEAEYDVVIETMGGHRLPRGVGKHRSLRRLVSDPANIGLTRALLHGQTCDVVVVVDAITLGVLPASTVRAGTAAVLALGSVGVAVPAAAVPAVGAAVADVAAVSSTGVAGQAGGATAADVRRAQKRATSAADRAAAADEAAALARGRAALQAEDRKDALDALHRARAAAQPAVRDLADAGREVGDAKRGLLEAEQRRADVDGVAGVVIAFTTGGAGRDEAGAAAHAESAADARVEAAVSDAAAAYAEYQEFAAEVEAAEAAFVAADAETRRARADAQERAVAAQAARTKAARLSGVLAEVAAAQGLHPPATGRITSAFGPRVHPVTGVYKLHTGTDFAGTDGRYYAAADGVVTYAGYDGAYGYMVHVDHGTVDGRRLETWYAHQPGLDVSVGQQVSRGEVIGRIGNTGYSTGPHAHVELHVDGQATDIMPFLANSS
jgi:murein DD-endopeptidase MepM/ murein hydrolase activator NlpD